MKCKDDPSDENIKAFDRLRFDLAVDYLEINREEMEKKREREEKEREERAQIERQEQEAALRAEQERARKEEYEKKYKEAEELKARLAALEAELNAGNERLRTIQVPSSNPFLNSTALNIQNNDQINLNEISMIENPNLGLNLSITKQLSDSISGLKDTLNKNNNSVNFTRKYIYIWLLTYG